MLNYQELIYIINSSSDSILLNFISALSGISTILLACIAVYVFYKVFTKNFQKREITGNSIYFL